MMVYVPPQHVESLKKQLETGTPEQKKHALEAMQNLGIKPDQPTHTNRFDFTLILQIPQCPLGNTQISGCIPAFQQSLCGLHGQSLFHSFTYYQNNIVISLYKFTY